MKQNGFHIVLLLRIFTAKLWKGSFEALAVQFVMRYSMDKLWAHWIQMTAIIAPVLCSFDPGI